MKIVNRQPIETADVSSARSGAAKEFGKLVLTALGALVAAYFLIGVAIDFAVSKISVETEAKLFAKLQPPDALVTDEKSQKQLERLRAILDKLKTRKSVPPLPYRIMWLDHDEPNAFAFPGGTIGVTRGLVNALDDDIEVAFVLGHEIGHFRHRDHLQGMGRAIGFRILTAVIVGSASGADIFGQGFDFIFARRYSQEREKKADRYGLELVHAAYGKVAGADRLFRILQDDDKLPKWAYMFSTHPAAQKRIEDLQAHAATLSKSGERR